MKKKLKIKSKVKKYGSGGGLFDTDKKAYVDSVLNANKNLEFVNRLYDKNPKNIQVPGEKYPSTHLMGYDPVSSRVYPSVVNYNGNLKYLGQGDASYDYADSSKQYIQFPNAQQAEWFANSTNNSTGYKMGTGVLPTKGAGGKISKELKKASGNPKVIIDPSIDRSYHDPVTNTIYANKKEEVLGEYAHAIQLKEGKYRNNSDFFEDDDTPYKKPSIMDNEENIDENEDNTQSRYYNRHAREIKELSNNFDQYNSNFGLNTKSISPFLSKDFKEADADKMMYSIPGTIEYEAHSEIEPELKKQEKHFKMGGRVSKWEIVEDTPMYADGGHLPIITNDPNDPRLRAYNDSLSAYRSSIKDEKMVESYNSLGIPDYTNYRPSNTSDYTDKNIKLKPKGYANYYPKNATGHGDYSSAQGISIPEYQKPFQPISLQLNRPKQYIDEIPQRGFQNSQEQGLDTNLPIQTPMAKFKGKDYFTRPSQDQEVGGLEYFDKTTGKPYQFKNGGKTKSKWTIIE